MAKFILYIAWHFTGDGNTSLAFDLLINRLFHLIFSLHMSREERTLPSWTELWQIPRMCCEYFRTLFRRNFEFFSTFWTLRSTDLWIHFFLTVLRTVLAKKNSVPMDWDSTRKPVCSPIHVSIRLMLIVVVGRSFRYFIAFWLKVTE